MVRKFILRCLNLLNYLTIRCIKVVLGLGHKKKHRRVAKVNIIAGPISEQE